jgi:hypothetical protein
MKIGRNDPCPCGSGKKYKKCCLGSLPRAPDVEEEQLQEEATDVAQEASRDTSQHDLRQALQEATAAPDDSAASDPLDLFWDEFRELRSEEKPAAVRRAIDELEEFDGETALELVADIVEPLRRAGRIDQLEEILDRIAERHPEAYQSESRWFELWRAENAVYSFPERDLLGPLMTVAQGADRGIGEFHSLVEGLCYHGKAKEILQALHVAWPRIADSTDIFDWAKAEVWELGYLVCIGAVLDDNPRLVGNEAELVERVAFLGEVDEDQLRQVVEHMSGRSQRVWSRDEFAFSSPSKQQGRDVFFLSLEFSGALHSRWGWSRSRATLARNQIAQYLGNRASSEDASDEAPSDETPASFIEPDADSAHNFVDGPLQALFDRPHPVGCFCLALPLWAEFLADRDLLDREAVASFRQELREMWDVLPELFDRQAHDRVLVRDVSEAWGP